jgi:hypothetical protein
MAVKAETYDMLPFILRLNAYWDALEGAIREAAREGGWQAVEPPGLPPGLEPRLEFFADADTEHQAYVVSGKVYVRSARGGREEWHLLENVPQEPEPDSLEERVAWRFYLMDIESGPAVQVTERPAPADGAPQAHFTTSLPLGNAGLVDGEVVVQGGEAWVRQVTPRPLERQAWYRLGPV